MIDTKDNSCFYKEKFHMKKDHKVTYIRIINCKINLKIIKKEYKIIIVKCELQNCWILNDPDHKIKHKKIYQIDLFWITLMINHSVIMLQLFLKEMLTKC